MNNIQIFNNPQFGEIRIQMNADNEPMFCLVDICNSLGIANHRNVRARLDEEDVRLMDTLTRGGTQQIAYITESGLYDTILRSDSDNSKPFRRWVTREVLPSIRKTGAYFSPSHSATNPKIVEIEAQFYLADMLSHRLRLNEASKLGIYQAIAEPYNIPVPQYVPSKGIMKAAKDLLKEINAGISVVAFNKLLVAQGYLETLSRPSSKGVKKFQSITEKGLPYGENVVSPRNQNETQPHWYADKFRELYNIVINQ